ncbi:MAG: phosphatidylglycerophosphatase A [Sedimentisphaerales bacterium]|nr:phosphatidylglycerophosphatase A [Sedimentisphaerales bacterium]
MKKLILSCFGLGFLPGAPGTWGSIPPLVIFLVFHYFYPTAVALSILLVIMLIVSSILCLLFAGEAEELAAKKDPSWIVIDEFAGQSAALIAAAFTGGKVLLMAAGAFLLFRIFDIVKPWPVCRAEKLPGGLGILADDIAAGVLAAIVLGIIEIFII